MYVYVSAYYYMVLCHAHLYKFPHTTIYVASYYYICVLILLFMCPHTTIYLGEHGNLLKIRPPLAFTAAEVPGAWHLTLLALPVQKYKY